jgi:hypothetical protein
MTELETALKEIDAAMSKYADYGASDSEPIYVVRKILENAVNGKPVKVPRTGNDWQLYSCSMDCSEPASVLHNVCQKAVDIILNTPMKNSDKVRSTVLGW